MRKKIKIFALGICLLITFFFITKQNNPLVKLDGFSGVFIPILLATDDSEYSKNYSHSKFLQIKNGMNMSQVYEILGKPIREDKYEDGNYCLWYSWSPNSTHYRRRNIIFENNIVTFINSEYYID